MRKNTIINLAHLIIQNHVNKNSIVIDATLGNGYDSNFLAPLVKKVYAFDVLNQAISNSKKLNSEFKNISYHLTSHENFKENVNSHVDLIIYNLGYLPGFDKDYTTKATSTLKSIKTGLEILKKQGKIVICIYIGHENGKIESECIKKFVKTLNKYEYDVLEHKLINKDNFPPYIIEILKK